MGGDLAFGDNDGGWARGVVFEDNGGCDPEVLSSKTTVGGWCCLWRQQGLQGVVFDDNEGCLWRQRQDAQTMVIYRCSKDNTHDRPAHSTSHLEN